MVAKLTPTHERQMVDRAVRWLKLNYEMRDRHPNEWFAVVEDRLFRATAREELERKLRMNGFAPGSVWIGFASPRNENDPPMESEEARASRMRRFERESELLDEADQYPGEWYAIVDDELFHHEDPFKLRSILRERGIDPSRTLFGSVLGPGPHWV